MLLSLLSRIQAKTFRSQPSTFSRCLPPAFLLPFQSLRVTFMFEWVWLEYGFLCVGYQLNHHECHVFALNVKMHTIAYLPVHFLNILLLLCSYFCLLLQVFVANPNKPREVKVILAKNHEKLTELLQNLSAGKGYTFLAIEISFS